MNAAPHGSVVLFLCLVAGCTRTPAQVPPAAAEKPKVEADLARTTLSPRAFASLGIRSEPVRNEPVQEHVRLTGWVMPRPGHEVTVTAPVAGYVRKVNGGGVPVPGLRVGVRDTLLVLEPVLSPVEQIQLAALKRGVENELTKAQESITAAESELLRVEGLQRQGLRGQQDVEQALLRLKHAQADLAAARDKLKLFAASVEGKTEARLPLLTLPAPRAGTVLMVHVSPGQYVPAAAPLVTLADLGELWLRVPVPEHDLARINRTHAPTVTWRTGPAFEFDAEPMDVVPQVDLARHTADLFYKLAPTERARQLQTVLACLAGTAGWTVTRSHPPLPSKDQMLPILVPVGGRRDESVVPYAAVVFDAHGGTWVYLDHTPAQAAEHVFERRRVELGPNVADGVTIRPPLRPGERVVVAGAAALFSREFHKPPVAGAATPAVDDDD